MMRLIHPDGLSVMWLTVLEIHRVIGGDTGVRDRGEAIDQCRSGSMNLDVVVDDLLLVLQTGEVSDGPVCRWSALTEQDLLLDHRG